jgi:hypothetical protein
MNLQMRVLGTKPVKRHYSLTGSLLGGVLCVSHVEALGVEGRVLITRHERRS